jgi:hypothetical protein
MGKFLLGALMFVGAIALGVYVGLWLMFVGGIIGLVTAVTTLVSSGVVMGMLIGISIVKIVLASLVGYLSFAVLAVPAIALMKSA